MNMIEIVARAICESMHDEFNQWGELDSEEKEAFMGGARAAISAMREPTDAMKKSVYDAENSMGVCYAAYEEINWETAWEIAIDAALKEAPNAHDR